MLLSSFFLNKLEFQQNCPDAATGKGRIPLKDGKIETDFHFLRFFLLLLEVEDTFPGDALNFDPSR